MTICGPGTLTYNAMLDGINSPAFKDNLVTTYEEILEQAYAAEVYVADYPYLAPEGALYCDAVDFTGARTIQDALNSVIHQAVYEVRIENSNLHLVETNFTGSPFENRYACGGETPNYFNGVILPSYKYSFHPNRYGQAAYSSTFREVILSN